MGHRLSILTFAMVGLVICSGSKAAEIDGWGNVINPDGDCTFEVDDGTVTIRLPKTKHDLWYGGADEKTRFNSPRVLQEVEGNFVATVRVTALWRAGIAGGGYNGAGLVVWDSEKQYLRHERNRFVNRSSGPDGLSYTTPLYDQNNRRVFYNSTADDFFKDNSTWLRIARYDSIVVASMSHDGRTWTRTGVLTTEFSNSVQVGIHATNSTGRAFAVLYDQFSVTSD